VPTSLKQWIDSGVQPERSAIETKHIRATSLFATVCGSVLGLWSLLLLALDQLLLGLEFGAATLVVFSVLLINRRGRQPLAAALLFLVIHVQIAMALYLFGPRSGASLFYFITVLAPFLLFSRSHRRIAYVFSVMGALAWVGTSAASAWMPQRFFLLDASIAERLKADPDSVIADRYEEVTILFADLVGFTPLSARMNAVDTVALLNEVFTAFDQMCEAAGVEKIRTIGDGYMAVCGAPVLREDHALVLGRVAIQMRDYMSALQTEESLQVRIGLNSGEAVAAIVGTSRFHFDLWGDAVNVAARMESLGEPGRIHIARPTFERIKDQIPCEPRGEIQVKGKGAMETWFVV
jgi:class 3 adenylate cyclase